MRLIGLGFNSVTKKLRKRSDLSQVPKHDPTVCFCPNVLVSIIIGLFRSQVIVFANFSLCFYFVSSSCPQFIRICIVTHEVVIVVFFLCFQYIY